MLCYRYGFTRELVSGIFFKIPYGNISFYVSSVLLLSLLYTNFYYSVLPVV